MRAICLVLLLAACGEAPPNVGAACDGDQACDEGLSCELAVAGGYCTRDCTRSGDTSECPEDSICDDIFGAATACVRICQSSADCREDQDCNGVSGSNVKACKPKL